MGWAILKNYQFYQTVLLYSSLLAVMFSKFQVFYSYTHSLLIWRMSRLNWNSTHNQIWFCCWIFSSFLLLKKGFNEQKDSQPGMKILIIIIWYADQCWSSITEVAPTWRVLHDQLNDCEAEFMINLHCLKIIIKRMIC